MYVVLPSHRTSTLADEQSINTTEINGQGFGDSDGEPIPLPLKENERGEVSFRAHINRNTGAEIFSPVYIQQQGETTNHEQTQLHHGSPSTT
jgi:hypothetical protein